MSSIRSKYLNRKNNNTFTNTSEVSNNFKLEKQKQPKIINKIENNSTSNNKPLNYSKQKQYFTHNYSRDQSSSLQSDNNFYNSKENNYVKYRNLDKSNLPKEQSNSSDSKYFNNKINSKNKFKNIPVIIEIEYEKITNNKSFQNDENGNFNVYFMKPDLRAKTISSTKKCKALNNLKLKKKTIQNQNTTEKKNEMINEDEEENPYNDNNYNFSNKEKQFQERNSDIMPLEIIHLNKERQFKSNLVQKLISFKLKQVEKDKIPLNLAYKKRKEENFQNSLKHLLVKQSQPIDMKKELMYYKGYFRFWKRKCKSSFDQQRYKKRFKKDRNIRITTVIYKAEKPVEEKHILTQSIKFRKNLVIILENRKKYLNNTNLNFTNKNINKENINKNEEHLNKIVNDDDKKENIKLEKSVTNISKQKREKNKQKDFCKNIYSNNNINKNDNIGSENLNNIYCQNEKNKLNAKKILENNIKKKEALIKINKAIEKKFEVEGFKHLKNLVNKGEMKEETEKLESIIEKNNSNSKIQIINEPKENQNKNKILEAFNILNNLIIDKTKIQIFNGYKKLKQFNNFTKSQNNNLDNNNDLNRVKITILKNEINNNQMRNEKESNINYEKDFDNNININNNSDKLLSSSQQIHSDKEIDNICNVILDEINHNEEILIDKNKNKKENNVKNIEGKNEKWTINKFNWKLGDSIKETDSLFGLSEDELKNSRKIKNSLNLNEQINNSQKIKTNANHNILIKQNQEILEKDKNSEEEQIIMNHYMNQNNNINKINGKIRYSENEEENEKEEEEFIYEEGEENEVDMNNINPKKIIQTTEEEEDEIEEEQIYQNRNKQNKIKNEEGKYYNEEEMENNYKNGGEENEINGDEEEYNYEEIEGGEIYLDKQNQEEFEEIEQEEGEGEEEGEEAYYVVQGDNGEEGEEYIFDEENQPQEYNEEIEDDENGEEQGFVYVNDEELQDENINFEEEDNEQNNQ